MPAELEPPAPAADEKSVRLVPVSVDAMTALLNGDLERASTCAGFPLSDYFLSQACRHQWQRRVAQIASDPASAAWVARAVLDDVSGRVVGRAGFHGPPDDAGMVEIGYAIDPRFRRQGYARATVAALLMRAGREPEVHIVRAAIGPHNAASLAAIAPFGFVQVGEQIDPEDGLEIIYQKRV